MTSGNSKHARIRVDAGRWLGELPHNWNYIGYDEINYTYTPEGQELLGKFQAFQEKPFYVRAHHLLCTGNCHGSYKWGSTNAYLEDEAGNPIYDWTFVDLILDTILKYNCKPFVELGFMPQDLVDTAHYDAAKDNWTAQLYRSVGWACPPKDYGKWYDLIYHLVDHCIQRYGAEEIKSWYWELWNEPDIFYWRGTLDEFNKLYDFTAAAVKAACPEARVGGPSVTNPHPVRKSLEYLDKFLDHCVNGTNTHSGKTGTALDFITFHVKGGGYRADPLHRKQKPPSVKQILMDTQTGYDVISKYPGLNKLECILSEIDPDGWAAGGAWDNVNLNFRNTEYYPSFVAASFDKVSRFAREKQWDLRLLSWAFMFVGERCFEGTRTFSTQGIDKPILNLYRMYANMGDQEISFESSGSKNPLAYTDPNGDGEGPDISGFATLSGSRQLAVLIYNHHDDWDMAEPYGIEVDIDNLPFDQRDLILRHYRIDQAHSNAYAEWCRQGRPMYPEPGRRAAIKARDGLELLEPPRKLSPHDGKIRLEFNLPVHGISLLIIEPEQTH
ncbi:MAG: beta-xylosidase [Anaerolineae bacterium]|nr:beta-xylosidase [Anaerolineae bacterium]